MVSGLYNIFNSVSQCDHTNAVINQYHGLYNTIHSLVDSYKESNLGVSSITKAIEDSVLTAKSKIGGMKIYLFFFFFPEKMQQ